MVAQTQLTESLCTAHILTLDGSLQMHIILIHFPATEFNRNKKHEQNWNTNELEAVLNQNETEDFFYFKGMKIFNTVSRANVISLIKSLV